MTDPYSGRPAHYQFTIEVIAMLLGRDPLPDNDRYELITLLDDFAYDDAQHREIHSDD